MRNWIFLNKSSLLLIMYYSAVVYGPSLTTSVTQTSVPKQNNLNSPGSLPMEHGGWIFPFLMKTFQFLFVDIHEYKQPRTIHMYTRACEFGKQEPEARETTLPRHPGGSITVFRELGSVIIA